MHKYPPKHWNINFLGESFADWLEEDYHECDKLLVLRSAKIDWAYIEAALLPEGSPIKGAPLNEFFKETLYFQPTVKLFHHPYDLFHFRKAVMAEEDGDWFADHDFPPLKKDRDYFTLFYRNKKKEVVWVDISKAQYEVLKHFEKGISLNELGERLDNCTNDIQKEASEHLQKWINEWIRRPLLTQEKLPIKLT